MSTQKGRIFISYRRADSAGYAGRIYDRLTDHFDKDAIFNINAVEVHRQVDIGDVRSKTERDVVRQFGFERLSTDSFCSCRISREQGTVDWNAVW